MKKKTVMEYNKALIQLVKMEKCAYLSVFEKQQEFLLERINGHGKDYTRSMKTSFKSLFQHYLLLMSFDSISRMNGYLLQTDGIHQNSLGAGIIAAEVEKFIRYN